jgi:hypothetical protein
MNFKEASDAIADGMIGILGVNPRTSEPLASEPAIRTREIIRKAAIKSAAISGSLSLPPGPAGLITILPDMIAVWQVQSQMVADIAGAYGKKAYLTKEQMIYCLFKHSAGQAVRDFVVRSGERILIKQASLSAIQKTLKAVGIKVSQRVAGRAVSRWLPIIGAIGVAGYAFYDTTQVGKTAMDLFAKEVRLENEHEEGSLRRNS